MATPESSSKPVSEKASKPQITRVKLERRDANGKLLETKVIEFKDGNDR